MNLKQKYKLNNKNECKHCLYFLFIIYDDKSELLRIAKLYLKSSNLFEMNLRDSIEIANNKYKEYTIFIIGSFYIYGDVLKYIKQ